MLAHAKTAVRYTLGVALGFVALNAFGGGAYGLAGAENVPPAWLEGSPFRDYLIPSTILLFVVGGSSWLAALGAFANWHARVLALAASAILLGWIVVQVAIIGLVSPLQPFMAIMALVIATLAQLLAVTEQRPAVRHVRSH